jgi:hypothetical protein
MYHIPESVAYNETSSIREVCTYEIPTLEKPERSQITY